MKLRTFMAAAALAAGFTAFAQPSDWNVQYVKMKNYGSPAAYNPRKIDIPDIDGYTTLKVDFHMHTVNSDGQVAPQIRVLEAFREGLDAIAITDHQPFFGKPEGWDYDKSYKQAISDAKARDILLIRGMELSHNDCGIGHMNFLFLNDCNDYKIKMDFGQKEVHDALVQAQKEGAWVTGNHPGWPDENSELNQFWTEEIEAGRIQGIEVFNSYEFYPLAIDHARKYNLAFIGASDEHRPMDMMYDLHRVMRPMTFVFAEERSVEAIHDALKARRTVAYSNNTLAGDPKWLRKLFKASLKIEKIEDRGSFIRTRIYNQSDIDYFLDCGLPAKQIYIPAHHYFDDERLKSDLELEYKVTNMFISSTECLSIPMSALFTKQSDIDMPAVDYYGIAY
ncbi:MAG: CehA/McbA family metallohydrolase, partial [Bacteroidales bacterium]|nr:CehA/McbA family metallohydrolase [Candidatus Cryptobacteroides equifaecalis]